MTKVSDTNFDFDSLGETDPLRGFTQEDIEHMLDFILTHLRPGDFRDMFESFYSQFERRGWLSAKQLDLIERTYYRELER